MPPPRMPMVHYKAPGEPRDRVLLIMLPGVGIAAEDFAVYGFLDAVGARGLPVDILAARPDLDHYLEHTIAAEIETVLVAPARAEGYRRIWLLGLSLGGMGALLYARAHPEAVQGVILLAPFLGTPGMLAEVRRAGGLASWQPGEIATNDAERALLDWLRAYATGGSSRPPLYLGYARGDRFAEGHAMLAAHLRPDRVLVTDGGHDWTSWTRLWQLVLETQPFAVADG